MKNRDIIIISLFNMYIYAYLYFKEKLGKGVIFFNLSHLNI